MSLAVSGAEALAADVGVALGRRDICVPQELLYGPQVGTTIEQMGGEAVAQRVRVRRRRGSAVDDPHRSGSQMHCLSAPGAYVYELPGVGES